MVIDRDGFHQVMFDSFLYVYHRGGEENRGHHKICRNCSLQESLDKKNHERWLWKMGKWHINFADLPLNLVIFQFAIYVDQRVFHIDGDRSNNKHMEVSKIIRVPLN